jgi:hypothetical protein
MYVLRKTNGSESNVKKKNNKSLLFICEKNKNKKQRKTRGK